MFDLHPNEGMNSNRDLLAAFQSSHGCSGSYGQVKSDISRSK